MPNNLVGPITNKHMLLVILFNFFFFNIVNDNILKLVLQLQRNNIKQLIKINLPFVSDVDDICFNISGQLHRFHTAC